MTRIVRQGYLALVHLLLYIPIGVLILLYFSESRYTLPWPGWWLKWYERRATRTRLLDAPIKSLSVAVVPATLASMIGTLTAVGLCRYRFRGKQALTSLLFAVMMSPDIVMAISLLALFLTLGISLGFWSLLIAHITFCLPFVVITVYSRLRGFNPHLIDAAKDLGASEFQAFWRVIVPLAAPAILAGWLLSFTLSLDDVIVSFFVTGPGFEILPLKIYSMVRLGVKPEVNALATVLFVISLVLVITSQLLLKEKR